MNTASLLLIFFWTACDSGLPDYVPLPTRICVVTSHHGQPIPEAKVYLKYFTDTFPGYEHPPAFFDAVFQTGKDASGCLSPVPEGKHWIVAIGYDSLHYPHDVRGNLPVEISLDGKPILDTVLYVSEKH
jgi:hypothetical protein